MARPVASSPESSQSVSASSSSRAASSGPAASSGWPASRRAIDQGSASAAELQHLVEDVEAVGVDVVFTDETSSTELAETLADEAGGLDVVGLLTESLAAEGEDVVLVSKDLPLRVKAGAIGLAAQEPRGLLPASSGWTGMAEAVAEAA